MKSLSTFKRTSSSNGRIHSNGNSEPISIEVVKTDEEKLLQVLQFKIEGMHCASCVGIVENSIKNSIQEVKQVDINLATGKAFVYAKPGGKSISDIDKEIIETVDSIGYKATPLQMSSFSASMIQSNRKQLEKALQKERIKVAGSLGFTVPIILLHMSHSFESKIGNFLENVLKLDLPANWSHWIQLGLSLPVVGYFGLEFFKRAATLARKFQSSMDTLVAMGTGTAFTFSTYLTFFGTCHDMVYFESASVITSLVLLGRYLENRAKWKANDAVQAMQPLYANKTFNDGSVLKVPIESVNKDDVIVVKPGERIPIDGIVISQKTTGNSKSENTFSVDESMLTGESIPNIKNEGSQVYAGTVNIKQGLHQSSLIIRASGDASRTLLSRIVSMVEMAQSSKAPVQRIADRVSSIFVPSVLTISGLTALAWIGMQEPLNKAIEICVSMLVIACPCALGLATPTAIQASTGTAANRGILIKNATSLEKAKDVQILVFDKTGTLTEGRPKVIDFITLGDTWKFEVILSFLSKIEAQSQHPVSRAIVDLAESQGIEIQSLNADESIENVIGRGNKAYVNGHVVVTGNKEFMIENNIQVKDDVKAEEFVQEGKSLIFVAIDGQLVAILSLFDQLKVEAKGAIETCKKLGIKPILASGDRAPIVKKVARELGIDEYYSECSPQNKLELIRKFQLESKIVGMVGDGINDAPALSLADVSFAISSEHATAVALDASDIAVMKGDLKHVVDTVLLSRRTLNIIHQNLFWAFAYNLAALPAAALGYLRPEIASFAMAMSSISVVGNSLRLRDERSLRNSEKEILKMEKKQKESVQ